MNLNMRIILCLALLLIYLNIMVICSLVINRLKNNQPKGKLEKDQGLDGAEEKNARKLNSISKVTRIEAAVRLGLIGTEAARKALEGAVLKEKSHPVKLYMANALADIKHKDSIPVLIASLIHAQFWYRKRCNMLIADFGEVFDNYVPQLVKSDKIEIKELLVDFSKVYFSQNIKSYIMHLMDTKDDEMIRVERLYGSDDRNNCTSYGQLIYSAADTLAVFYPEVLNDDRYLYSSDVQIRNIALRALAHFNDMETISKLISFLEQEETSQSAANSISAILQRNPAYISKVTKIFSDEKNIKIKQKLAEFLSSITECLKQDGTKFLDARTTEKRSIDIQKESGIKNEEEYYAKLVKKLYSTLALGILIFPVMYAVRYMDMLLRQPFIEQLKRYIVDFNYCIGGYFAVVNGIFLFLLILSNFNAKRQLRLWEVKNISLLFKKKMLPTISIIAPAFNEAATIAERADSLLELKYPDYELIIINDGSKDSTLDVLIRHFNLIKINYSFEYRLSTKLVRGVYTNPLMPNLVVVDKEKGGREDSLNTGINISKKEYFCSLDADSLPEEDALLKLASLILDEGVETPALGGNICPINGCKVEKGHIKSTHIPQNKLARFQTVEHIRTFMGEKWGWAFMDSLLIISSTFGLFRKERVISAGGYLADGESHTRDTEREDMTLVVRICKMMREMKHSYRICYTAHANCLTKVPEELQSLKKQRFRLQRGLMDLLTFHNEMLFNLQYGRTGIVAMSYFFIFEMVGPIIELQGCIMIVTAFFLGLLNAEIAVWLFASNVLLGILGSLSSLIILEKYKKQFTFKELIILVGYAVAENFGPRQFLSLYRLKEYMSMLTKKGFYASNNGVKE